MRIWCIWSARAARVAAAGGLAVMALAVAPTQAAGDWQPPVDLSAPGANASSPQVAMDQAGDAIAVWERSNGTITIVQAAVRPAGGSFSAPVDVSAPGQDASFPQVAMDQGGDAVVVWERSNGPNTIVQAAVRPAGGSFAAPVNLSAAGEDARRPQVAIDQAGDAVAVWQRSNGTNTIVQAAVRPAGGTFAAPSDLSAPGHDALHPQVAVDQAGDAVVVWDRSNGTNGIVQAAVRSADGGFAAPVDLSAPGGSASYPQVALDRAGGAVAVWDRFNGVDDIVQAATRSPAGDFGAPVDLSRPGGNASRAEVAIDPAGDAIAVWRRTSGDYYAVQAAARPAGGRFAAAVDLSPPGRGAPFPQVGLNQVGDALAVWDRFTGANVVVQSATRPAGGSFAAPVAVSAVGGNASSAQVAVNNAGAALAVWTRSNGINTIVQFADFAPSLSATRVAPRRFVVSGRRVRGRCVAVTRRNQNNRLCTRQVKLRISYKLSFSARVTFTIKRVEPGRRANGICVKPTRKNRKNRHCTRLITVPGTLTTEGQAGDNGFTWNGRVGGRMLGPGTYTLTATPAAGGAIGNPQTVVFRIVR